jgi:hypothetical protein
MRIVFIICIDRSSMAYPNSLNALLPSYISKIRCQSHRISPPLRFRILNSLTMRLPHMIIKRSFGIRWQSLPCMISYLLFISGSGCCLYNEWVSSSKMTYLELTLVHILIVCCRRIVYTMSAWQGIFLSARLALWVWWLAALVLRGHFCLNFYRS